MSQTESSYDTMTRPVHHKVDASNGCVCLASLGRPCSAHSGEPLTKANGTITLALSW